MVITMVGRRQRMATQCYQIPFALGGPRHCPCGASEWEIQHTGSIWREYGLSTFLISALSNSECLSPYLNAVGATAQLGEPASV